MTAEWGDTGTKQVLIDLISWFYAYHERTGVLPDVIVAPYGHYRDMVNCVAASEYPAIMVKPHPDDFEGRRLYKIDHT